MKECPEWMQFSTITSAEHLPSIQQASSSETWNATQNTAGTPNIVVLSLQYSSVVLLQMYNEMRRLKQNC